MNEDVGTRWIAWIGTTSIHLAVGWALLAMASGSPLGERAVTERGKPVTFSMASIERASDGVVTPPATSEDARGSIKERARDRLTDETPPATSAALPDPANADHDAVETTTMRATASAELSNAEVLAYRARLQAHLARYRVYPAAARSASQEGVVVLRLEMDRAGQVVDVWVEMSSGVSSIDDEAVAAVTRAQPLPVFPAGWPDRMSIAIPVAFRLG